MELKAQINMPFEEKERLDFIIEQNHNLGYEIKETETTLEAWGDSEEEALLKAKEAKLSENTQKAKQAIENGYINFKNAQFETNAQTVGDLTATMLMLQAHQNICPSETLGETDSSVASLPLNDNNIYSWLSKDDKVVELNLQDFITLGGLIAEYKNAVWNNKYVAFKSAIEEAETLEELDLIKIDY